MGDTNTNSAFPPTVEARDLPSLKLSQEKIDRLLKALAVNPILNSDLSSTAKQKLKGREVLVPAFGGVAFYEGELLPDTRSKPGSSTNEEEETVFIPTIETTKKLAGGKQQQNPPDEKDVTVVGLSEAIEWLQKYSMSSNESTKPQISGVKTTNTAAKVATKPPSGNGPSKPPPSTIPKSATTSKQSLPKSSSRAPNYYPNQAPAGSMFNINEEYSADGARIVGEAVNLSTRLKAVYGDDNPENFSEDSKMEEDNAPFDPTLAEDKEKSVTSAKDAVSDKDYDRISKRLEELALMEEEEAKREKEGRRKPAKPLGGEGRTKASTQTKKTKGKSTSSFGFQKGFLNKKTSKTKKIPKTKPAKRDSTSSQSGVTIDVSQNKVHEIPREGRQQPVPARKPSQQDQGHVAQSSNDSRLLDASVFSGQISERTMPMGSSSSGVISSDVAARVAANEQTQSLQHELQQQQRQARPKRVSRFRQQRQQEQQQQQQR